MIRTLALVPWRQWTGALLLLGATLPVSTLAQSGPQYSDPQTRRVVEGMVAAHGGMDRWLTAPSLRFTAGMYLASLPVHDTRSYSDNWRYYTVTMEPRHSTGFVRLPFEDPDRPLMAYDGEILWSSPYDFDPSYRDGPFQLLFMHYGWITLPWLTQQPEVSLKSLPSDTLPGSSVAYDVVEMTFNPQNKVHGGYFRLFIDKETSLLRGFTQTVGYVFLPGNVVPQNLNGSEDSGGVFRIIESYVEVDGLTIPRSYNTIRIAEDSFSLLGAHLVIDPSFTQPFDADMLALPEDARILVRPLSADTPTYTVAHRTAPAPAIDGRLDDEFWKSTLWRGQFQTQTGGDPTQRTRFALGYDDTSIYLGMELNDVSPDQITQTPGARDDTNGDRIAAFFDMNTDGVTANVFVINAAGVVRDQSSTVNGTQWDNEWDTEWTHAHVIDEAGWKAEFSIPFSSLGLSGPPSGEWGFQLTRVVTRMQEQSFWSRPTNAGFIGSFGRIVFDR